MNSDFNLNWELYPGNRRSLYSSVYRAGLHVSNANARRSYLKVRSSPKSSWPVLGLPVPYQGCWLSYPSPSQVGNQFSWISLKRTRNRAGKTTLDPRDTPETNFHYFTEGSDNSWAEDLASVNGVELCASHERAAIAGYLNKRIPVQRRDRARTREAEAWGHHALCINRIVTKEWPCWLWLIANSCLRVSQCNLRVDASVFPFLATLSSIDLYD